MARVVALIDGEHYPPVVRFALDRLAERHDVVGAAFIGGTEKVDRDPDDSVYGVRVIRAHDPVETITLAIREFGPQELIDLSDEPVVTVADRFRLAGIALTLGVAYSGADFRFEPPGAGYPAKTPTLAIIGTGKRVGKTGVSAHVARHLTAGGLDLVVLAMGRGGPADPELIRGDEVALTTKDLLELASQGKHASSDNYEDAVMSRVTTVGCRRCGGGMAGETFFSNVEEGAALADSLGKGLLIVEGSGAAIPPVRADATLLVVGAGRGLTYVADHFGPYRLARADAVVIAGAEEPLASLDEVSAVRAAIADLAPGLPCIATTFRPRPLESIEGARVFFATTAPAAIVSRLVDYLEGEYGCTVVASSPHLSNRTLLRDDLSRSPGHDLLLTELKAAAVDVVAAAGEVSGVPTVLCDNVPVAVDGGDLEHMIDALGTAAVDRGREREG